MQYMHNHTGGTARGYACGIMAAVAYGTNPLFSLRLLRLGLDVETILFCRFALAALALGVFVIVSGRSLAVPRRAVLPLVVAGVVFAMSSQTLYQSFLYMDAGIACSILFVYPILVAVIMALFFHERASWLTYACIAVALAGIALLYRGDGSGGLSLEGLLLVVASSLFYAIYIVGVDHSRLAPLPSVRMTFWVLSAGALTFLVITGMGTQLRPVELSSACLVNVVGVALVPTVIPILFINVAIKSIGPTSSAVIGALEPVTALVIGATVFGESVTPRTVLGAAMIFAAVIVIVCRPAIERVRHKKGASHSEKG